VTEILGEARRYPSPSALKRALDTLKAELGVPDKQLTLVFTSDADIHALNREHLGVDSPTDVLSFPLVEPGDEGFPEVPHLGDIVISLDTAQRQANAAGHTLEREIATLAAHGLTHLLGHDHPTEAAWTVFRANQTRILALLSR
jgi:probable rRNA maturation factor